MGTLIVTVGACDEAKPELVLPTPTREIEPLDIASLLAGNRAIECYRLAVDARVETLLSQMTLEQKVFEMHGTQAEAVEGLYLAGGNSDLGLAAFKMVDGPRGVRAGNASAFPVGMARGATWDPWLERRVGLAIGAETAAKGGNVLLGPTINIPRHPGWGRAQETYSEDPFHMGRMALGFIGGVQNHVLASAKHFAVNSVENTRFSMSANLSEKTLREVYLPHFAEAVQVGRVASVMSAYNRVNGTFCGEHAHLLGDVLKREWGFEGFVESDWFLGTRSTVPSISAGLDIEMPQAVFYGEPLRDALVSGEVEQGSIDDAVRRILRQKLCFGLDAPNEVDAAVIESEEHRALAREVAIRSTVLLKNERNVLPLSPSASRRIVLVGALATLANLGDRGSSSVTPTHSITPAEGLLERLGSARVDVLNTNTPTALDLDVVAAADVAVIVAGLTYLDEGEFIPVSQVVEGLERGGDRASLGLPAEQVAMIRAVAARAKRTVVVLEGGSAVVVREWVDDVDALLMAWYPGMEGGTAIAEMLVGDAEPGGRLPITFPRSEAQLPTWDITSDEVEYGYLHGYRLFDATDSEPEYAFGFGLGYTSTVLSRLRLDRNTVRADDTVLVSVDVANLGARVGTSVVQVYASAESSTVERAPRWLVGFARVDVDPGSAATVQVAIGVQAALQHWDEAHNAWAIEPTSYVLHVGTSSRDLPLTAKFHVMP